MNPICKLPAERRSEALAQFDGCLSCEEERQIRDMFPQYRQN